VQAGTELTPLPKLHSQHYSKTIMKDFKARHPNITATSLTETPSPASARKTKAAAGKANGASTPSKKRTKKSAAVVSKDDEEDDTELDATPSKRVKKEEKAAPVKKEEKATPAKDEEEAAETTTEA
jgi:hypothetical protein